MALPAVVGATAQYWLPPLIEGGLSFLGGIGQSKIEQDRLKREEALAREQLAQNERQMEQNQQFGGFDRASSQLWQEYGTEAQNVETDNVRNAMVNTLSDIMLLTGQTPVQLGQRIRPQAPTAQQTKTVSENIFQRPTATIPSSDQGRGVR